MQKGDWRSVEQLYAQVSALLEHGAPIPSEVSGGLALGLDDVFDSYQTDPAQFIDDLYNLMLSIDNVRFGNPSNLFEKLYRDLRLDKYQLNNPENGGQSHVRRTRRMPTPLESAVETCRRLRDIKALKNSLEQQPIGAVIGGSLSYGRFYSVSGSRQGSPSDVDILIIVDDYKVLPMISKSLEMKEIEAESLAQFKSRAREFVTSTQQDYHPCIFSHKLRMWGREQDTLLRTPSVSAAYSFSLHIMSVECFKYTTLADIVAIEDGLDRTIYDYRDTEPTRGYIQKSFAGIPTAVRDLQPQTVEKGYVTKVPICFAECGRYYAGFYHSLMIPAFNLNWELRTYPLSPQLAILKEKIVQRLRAEQEMRPFERQQIGFAHFMFHAFAPHMRTIQWRPADHLHHKAI